MRARRYQRDKMQNPHTIRLAILVHNRNHQGNEEPSSLFRLKHINMRRNWAAIRMRPFFSWMCQLCLSIFSSLSLPNTHTHSSWYCYLKKRERRRGREKRRVQRRHCLVFNYLFIHSSFSFLTNTRNSWKIPSKPKKAQARNDVRGQCKECRLVLLARHCFFCLCFSRWKEWEQLSMLPPICIY